jgi:riboflavin kinase/FMN adenylyltransferase
MTLDQKLEALGKAGIHGAAVVRFTTGLSRWEPEKFVKAVLVDWLRVAEVWVGADFLFGRDRSGNFTLLKALGSTYNFRAEKIDPVRYKDFVVSSTRIRRLVAEGRVDEAGALLGHHFFIDGKVVRGAGRGQQLGIDRNARFGHLLHRAHAAGAGGDGKGNRLARRDDRLAGPVAKSGRSCRAHYGNNK